ncbi:Asp-tRNA(Asn)/Glu-tRNA(Gln) amidotransferase subunit GatC [Treponema sp. OMZ 840]|uniref:Asp-tRNA(Asn)/Glu-tRNA(Gln) amidotransferase subunit GatC n=1 Tax=Treponema sp. OMZ 840 TaxID=244313 RepID=UPI003D8CAB8F
MNSKPPAIDENMLEALLYLSRLAPSSIDLKTLKNQVEQIVGYFNLLSEFDDTENPFDAYPSSQADVLREDTPVPGLDIPDVKKMTNEFMDGYFRVPKVLGEGA